MFGRTERRAVGLGRLGQRCRGKVRRKRIGQSKVGGQLRPIEARPEDPDRHFGPGPRHGTNACVLGPLGEIGDGFQHVVGKAVAAGHVAPQGPRGLHVRARRAPEPEVDAVRE